MQVLGRTNSFDLLVVWEIQMFPPKNVYNIDCAEQCDWMAKEFVNIWLFLTQNLPIAFKIWQNW